ncbi:hypothetical protein Tco_1221729 [Tanacetum coccineum]
MEHGSEKMKSLEKIEEEDIQEEMKEVVKESGAKKKESLPEKEDYLHTLFEPDEEDEIWKNQHEYNVIS